MADFLDQGLAWLESQRVAHMSRTVTYQRPSAGSGQAAEVEVNATLGATTYEVADEYGATVEAKATDFLIAAAELVLDEQRITPEPGDHIRVTAEGVTRIFEVMDLGDAGHYRPSDPYGRTLRIHTKVVDMEAG